MNNEKTKPKAKIKVGVIGLGPCARQRRIDHVNTARQQNVACRDFVLQGQGAGFHQNWRALDFERAH